jgi:polyisoprenoid-binding protein YceI
MSVATDQIGKLPVSDGVWTVDPDRSEIGFAVKAMYGLLTVRGMFGAYDGTLTVRADSAAGELAIDTDSLDTGNHKRDQHLRSSDGWG